MFLSLILQMRTMHSVLGLSVGRGRNVMVTAVLLVPTFKGVRLEFLRRHFTRRVVDNDANHHPWPLLRRKPDTTGSQKQ